MWGHPTARTAGRGLGGRPRRELACPCWGGACHLLCRVYAPHTLPEGWWNFKRSRAATSGQRCRVPRRVGPFITKAHETLTRRPGGSSVSVSRVRRRPGHHSPNRSRRGGSHRLRAARVASSPGIGSGDTFPEGLRSRGSSQGCFQRGSSCEPLPPRVPGHCQPPRPRLASRSAPSVRHLSVRGTEGLQASQPGTSHLSGLFRDSNPSPLPDYEPGVRGGSEVHSVTRSMSGWFSCPSPARPCSEFQLVLATLGLILSPRRRRPLRPSRACRASQLTGYLIALG